MSGPFRRYGLGARWYDVLSAERPVYRAGRRAGIALMELREGDVVLDLGCGTGLNLPLLRERVGADGLIVGIDRSPDMLRMARERADAAGWANVRLLQADAAALDPAEVIALVRAATGRDRADALLSTYALSVMRADAGEAWRRALRALRPGGVVCVVDMQVPTGRWRIFAPLARLACALGGADITLHPWRMLEAAAAPGSVRRAQVRGNHIVAVAARLP